MIANGRRRRIDEVVPYYLPSPPIWQYGYASENSYFPDTKIVISFQYGAAPLSVIG